MSAVASQSGQSAALRFARGINVGLAVFLVLYGTIAVLQPGYFEVEGFLNFLRRAAPLIILACGQLFVIAGGGFDLSMGSLVTSNCAATCLTWATAVPMTPGSG